MEPLTSDWQVADQLVCSQELAMISIVLCIVCVPNPFSCYIGILGWTNVFRHAQLHQSASTDISNEFLEAIRHHDTYITRQFMINLGTKKLTVIFMCWV